MKKILLFLIVVLMLGLLSGCNDFVAEKPSSPEDTLLVGQITLEFKDGSTKKKDIEMTLENTETNEKMEIDSKFSGIIYKYNLEPGVYLVKKLQYRKTEDDMISRISSSINNTTPIVIGEGKVTNIGSIKWIMDEEELVSEIISDKSPQELYDYLSEEYPESEWLDRTWLNIAL